MHRPKQKQINFKIMKLKAYILLLPVFALAAAVGCTDETKYVAANLPGPFEEYDEVLAFPSAVGFGRYASGGRGGEIYHVTNLNTEGEGSIVDAVSKTGRIIVFDVAGFIDLGKLSGRTLQLKSNQTLLFQTAPADGIVLTGGRVSSSGASNLIVRYMRVRVGRTGVSDGSLDAGGLASGKDVIYDHCSFIWGEDECFSINTDNKGTRPQNITLQNCIFGQGQMNHSAGGLIQTNDDEGVTLYRNLYIDNATRNNKIKGLNQYVNNVVYNWTDAAYIMGGDSDGKSKTQIENNYFIYGPGWVWRNTDSKKIPDEIKNNPEICSPVGDDGRFCEVLSQENIGAAFSRANADFSTYFVGNYIDKNQDGALNGSETTQANFTDNYKPDSGNPEGLPTFLTACPEEMPVIPDVMSAAEAYAWILQNGGATLPKRDKVEQYLIDELSSLGTKGVVLRDERKPIQYGLAGTWKEGFAAQETPNYANDTDKDGIPDEWERQYGLNPNDPSDAAKFSNNGYSNIENYLFSLEN